MKKENSPKDTGNNATGKKGLTTKEEVAQNPDKHIDQDFPGFPHAPSKESTIKPKTQEDKVDANLKTRNTTPEDNDIHVGSANAFEATENDEVLRGELDKDDERPNKENNY
jgi:hypothetical protein